MPGPGVPPAAEPPAGPPAGRTDRRPGPSAALVLGALAGAFAAIMFLPTALPLVWQSLRAEEAFGLQRAAGATYAIHLQLQQGAPPSAELLWKHGLAALEITPPGGGPIGVGEAFAPGDVALLCGGSPPQGVVALGRTLHAAACLERDGVRVVAALPLDASGPARRIIGAVLLLALFVGLVTALGILRILNPLSVLSRAIDRVGAGERGVIVPQTGLWELDQLVDRLNSAARSVDDREDAILARIEVVQEMSRIVAHEIRNPLQSLELLTSLVAMEEDPKERLEIAQSIHQEIQTLEQVVHRLLRESAAKGALRLQLTRAPVAPLVEQVVALRRPQANSQGVKITVGAMSWTEVDLDAALVKRSIENLVLNALQAVGRSGEVRIEVVDVGPDLRITVADNGPGVPEHLVDHVFEPNVTHGKPKGLGLGLTLVKGVIEAHNGYVAYDRSPLGGARFTMHLPGSQPRSEEPPG